jgi:outer membrane protein OmpA-like peptidoglycan-associated protein
MAHELAHTMQQSGGDTAIQRFVPCEQARLSLEECPHREPGEASASRSEPSILIYITSPEVGYLITNFDIGKSKLKASAKLEPHWSEMIQEITKPGSKWQLLGLSDCHGDERVNEPLRQQRADAVRAALPATAATHIVGASGASLYECITDNSTRHHRTWNRAVLITRVESEMGFEGEEIEVKRPPVQKADTEDCDKNQKDALNRAFPLAKRMVQAAFAEINNNALLMKYFGKDARDHRFHIQQNFSDISKGLKAGPTFECEEADSWWCDGAVARVLPIVGENIHICPGAIDRGDDYLARTIVHEAAHRFAWIFMPDDLCAGGSGSMDTTDAEDNADCYGEFAGDALAQSP